MKKRLGRRKPKTKIRLGGDPILDVICEPVKLHEDVSDIIRDMRYILYRDKKASGISALQVGCAKRIIAVKNSKCTISVMINPEICETPPDEEKVIDGEGCLSYPGIFKPIPRFLWIIFNYKTELEIDICGVTAEGFYARVIQHEIDHLNGKCLVGKVNF